VSGVIGDLLVALAVLTSVLYATARLAPKPWRARLFAALAAALLRLGARRLAGRLTAAATRAGGCGGCGDCGPVAPPAGAETRIPVHRIGRRS
jgi:hypothetical protein